MHNNLFAYGDESEVYQALKRDSKRDSRQSQVMDLLIVAGLIFLARDLPTWESIAVVALPILGIIRLNTFIDNSNRNFFMHMIDWQHAQKGS